MERTITFLKPWGKRSWLVEYSGPYENDRPAHVEVGPAYMNQYKSGDVFPLSNLRASGSAIMWDVDSYDNVTGKKPHFTVYFGPGASGKVNAFR